MIISVIARKAYGQVRYYPANDAAMELAKLTKTETFTYAMLLHAKRMGAELVLSSSSQPEADSNEAMQFNQLFGKE